MTIRKRRILFYALIGVFLVLGSSIALYAQGWRLDLKEFKPVKVGAIYVQSKPMGAALMLDGKPIQNKTGIFSSGTFIDHLFPKSYTLELSSEEYLPWKRTLRVDPSLVSEVTNAILIPKKSTLLQEGPVDNFWLANKKILTRTNDRILTLDGTRILGDTVVDISKDGDTILTMAEAIRTFYLVQNTSTNINSELLRRKINTNAFTTISLDTETSNHLFLKAGNSLRIIELPSWNMTAVTSTGIIGPVSPSRSTVAWTEHDSSSGISKLFFFDKSSKTIREEAAFPGKTRSLVWSPSNLLAVVQENGSLYLHTTDENTSNQIANDVKQAYFSPNGNFIAALENSSLEIFSLKKKEDYWRFNLPDRENIHRLDWHKDNFHLFIHYPTHIRFLELKDFSLENLEPIAETIRAWYDKSNDELYFLQGSSIRSLKFPER